MDIPIYNLCSLIYEIELFKNWVPFCDESFTIKKVKRAEKLAYIKVGLPIISDRDGYIDGMGIDRLDVDETIVICCKTIHHSNQLMQKHNLTIP